MKQMQVLANKCENETKAWKMCQCLWKRINMNLQKRDQTKPSISTGFQAVLLSPMPPCQN